MFETGMEKINKIVGGILAILGVGLLIALIIAVVFFDIEVASVAPWFMGSVGIIFAIGFICALVFGLILAVYYFFAKEPWPALVFIGAILLVFIGLIIMWAVKEPVIDLGAYLDPIFSFLK